MEASNINTPSLAPQVVLEKLEDPFVLVGPARLLGKAVVLNREGRHRPGLLAQFDQPLHQPHGVLEKHVCVHHAMADKQLALQAVGKIDRRAAFVSIKIGSIKDGL